MASEYPEDSDDELVARTVLNLPTERGSVPVDEIENSETEYTETEVTQTEVNQTKNNTAEGNGTENKVIEKPETEKETSGEIYSRTHIIQVDSQDETDISQSDFIPDDNSTLPASSELDESKTPRPSISQDSGVVCGDYCGEFGEVFEASTTTNNSIHMESQESFKKSFQMQPIKKTDLDYSPNVVPYMESPVLQTGNAWIQKEKKFYKKGLSTDRMNEREMLSANHSVDQCQSGNTPMSIDQKFCFLMGSFLTITWIAILVCLIVGIILPVGLVGIMYDVGFPSVDKRVDSFRINSHPASKQRFVMEEIFRNSEEHMRNATKENERARRNIALNDLDFAEDEQQALKRKRRATYPKKRYTSATVYFYYTTKEKINVFTNDTLEIIHKFENEMAMQEEFKENCLHNYYHFFSYYTEHIDSCYPMASINGFFYPSPYRLLTEVENGTSSVNYESFAFDGFGGQMTNFEQSFDLMKSQSDFYSYFDSKFNLKTRESTYIKSTLFLGRKNLGSSEKDDNQKNKYILSQEDLIRKYEEKSDLEIYYFADGLMEHMLGLIIQADILKTIVSLSIIAVFVFFFTGGSPWLTFWTIAILLGSIVDNIFLYYMVFKIDKLGMLNAASGIILVSIGVDDVLVFINIFRSKGNQMNTRQKVASTLHGASISTFLTSFTTSLAFSANIISPVPAVKSFGLFMATLVLVCWLLVVILMPPVLYLWERHLLGAKQVLYKNVEKSWEKRKSRKTDPEGGSEDSKNFQICGICSILSVDFHSKLIDILNKFTHFVIKIRWVLMAIWLALLITSIYGVANLEADENIPTVFTKSNRLEEAMKIRQKNAYAPDLRCDECHPLKLRSRNFYHANWNNSRDDIRNIEDWQKYYGRAKRSTDPVKPLSSTVPLVAVVLGIWDYKVKTNSFYYTKPEVSITEDENFLEDIRNYQDLGNIEAAKIALQIGDKVKSLCKMCSMIAQNKQLVNNGRAQCIPSIESLLNPKVSKEHQILIDVFQETFDSFEECQGLPDTQIVSGDLAKGTVGYLNSKLPGYIIFVFESTMTEQDSAWDVRKQFIKWNDFIEIVSRQFSVSSGLSRLLFASDRFDAAFMEIAAQVGAFYSMGVGMSSILVLLAFFTGYLQYLVIILFTVVSSVLVLFGSFYYFSLKLGAVEIVAGSILVGSSVDYIFHLVESYSIYSRENSQDFPPGTGRGEMRRANCVRAMSRIGLSIISSSLTTVMGCLPLTFADLNPLRMFGMLIMISSVSALILTLLFGLPLLAIIAPVKAKITIKRRFLFFFCTTVISGLVLLITYTIMVAQKIKIIGPNGL